MTEIFRGSKFIFTNNSGDDTIDLESGLGETLNISNPSFTGPLLLEDGTSSSPSLTFKTDTNLGLYKPSVNTLGITNGGGKIAVFNTDGVLLTGSKQFLGKESGSSSSPSYSFENNKLTGMYFRTTDEIVMTNNNNISCVFNKDLTTVSAITSLNSYAVYNGISGAAQQSIPNATNTTFINYSTFYSVGDTVSTRPTASTGVITINKTGKYLVSYSIGFSTNATGIRSTYISRNGSEVWAYQNLYANPTDRSSSCGSAVIECVANDTIVLVLYQSSGIALLTDNAVPRQLVVYRLG